MPKALRDGIEAGGFRLVPKGVVSVRAVDDLGQEDHRWIAVEMVSFHERVERTFLAMMAELHALHIVGCRAFALGHFHYLVLGNEQELRLRVDEFADEPGTSHSVHFYFLARNALHDTPLGSVIHIA